MANFGERLKELRIDSELTQQEIADTLNLSKSTISMYENGKRLPEYETLEAIADFFNVDMDYLTGKSDYENIHAEMMKLKEKDGDMKGLSSFSSANGLTLETSDMNEIRHRIKQRREELGLSYQNLAEKTGLSKSTLQRYETASIKNLPLDKLEALAKALSVSPAYLMGWQENDNIVSEDIDLSSYDNILPIKTKKIPLLGEIACGVPIYADEDRESYVEVGTDIRADFALRAKGDSMIGAYIRDGDIVFIRRQPTVEEGEIAAVIIDDEATLKRVYFHKEIDAVELRADNIAYKSLIYSGPELEQLHILGKAIAFQSDVI
ncbi:helix-turn-helix domain-containing protein [Peptococcus simiae]|uniref:helix-turn-helix domain-containing protein n=1 Tax=Peptococcus simiae TaxID=1643805 RepID=UPI00397FE491